MTSAKIRPIIKFFRLRMQIWYQISIPMKPINLKILPDGTIYSTSHPRKWNKIQIWTDGPQLNLHFKSLASPLGRTPSKWRFIWQRITLRVRMCPSCSTSHSSSLDVLILLHESLETLKWLKNNSEKLYRGCGSSQNDFRQHSADHQFFRRRCANFVRIFGRAKSYKPKNPSGWHYLLDEPSPEMDSNPNSNGWTSI